MKILLVLFLLTGHLILPVSASEINAPEVPHSGAELIPADTDSFDNGLKEILYNAIAKLRPDVKEAAKVSLSVIAAVMMVSILQTFSGSIRNTADLAGSALISYLLLMNTNTLIQLGANTVSEITDYGKLFLPVMTSALAAQGNVTRSAALYTGSAAFITVLSSMISKLLLPMVYLFLALAIASVAVGEELLKKFRDLFKSAISWCLKTVLTVFTTYLSITGIVSGTTDAAALKAAKVTISSVVPVVGGILSDASEAVLVSTSLAKNAAGIYGILAVLAIFLEPFLQISMHYMLLKLTSSVCAIFGSKAITDLINDFACAMGLLLAMTGSVCLLLLISTVCFMKGVG